MSRIEGSDAFSYSHTNTQTQDRTCAPYTQCIREGLGIQYLQRKGDATHDNVCATITDCSIPVASTVSFNNRISGQPLREIPSQFQLHPAVDSTDFSINGTDAVCANFTECKPGEYANFTGNATHDVECAPCPIGTYGVDGFQCRLCRAGEFTDRPGSTNCTACKDCGVNGSGTAISSEAIPCSVNVPNGNSPGDCSADGYQRLCSAAQDAVCMQCPHTWKKDPLNGLCEKCATGYHLNQTTGICEPCQPHFYCPSNTVYEICQDLKIFERNAMNYRIVPSMYAGGAAFPSQCSCADAGGFEGGADGLGCRPCKNGWAAPEGQSFSGCHLCPEGKYAARETVQDLYRCPVSGVSPVIRYYQNDTVNPWPPLGSLLPGDPGCNVVVGATECKSCADPSRPHTKQNGSWYVENCTKCPSEHFFDVGSNTCKKCSAPCSGANAIAPNLFETRECTDDHDRFCSFCDGTTCQPGEYYSGCPGGNPLFPSRGCGSCTNAPSANARYIEPVVRPTTSTSCPWVCNEGFYSTATGNECFPCTTFNATTCPAGKIFVPCSDEEERDASCNMDCLPGDKPLLHSRWVKAVIDSAGGTGRPLRNDDPSRHNEACLWECEDGFEMVRKGDSNVALCVEKTS